MRLKERAEAPIEQPTRAVDREVVIATGDHRGGPMKRRRSRLTSQGSATDFHGSQVQAASCGNCAIPSLRVTNGCRPLSCIRISG